jgi:hypothetical protein
MFDFSKDPSWVGGVLSTEFIVARPMVRVRIRRRSAVFGRPISWVTEVIENEINRKLVMRITEGPIQGELSYGIVPAKDGSAVSIRNQSSVSLWFPGMGWFVRRCARADLRRLKAIVESEN